MLYKGYIALAYARSLHGNFPAVIAVDVRLMERNIIWNVKSK